MKPSTLRTLSKRQSKRLQAMIRKQISVNNERGCAQIVRICDRVIDLCSKYNHPDAAHTCRGHPPQLLAQEHRDHICKQLLASAADMKQAVGLWSGAPIDIFASGMEQKSRVFLAVCRTHLETLDNIQDLMTKHCRCQNSHERSSASTAPRPPVASSALPRQGDMQDRCEEIQIDVSPRYPAWAVELDQLLKGETTPF